MKPATSIQKVCRVLDAFRERPWVGVIELAEQTALLPSDAHRLLRSLEHFGYVEQDLRTKKYRLGLKLLKLGHLVYQRIELREVARPFLQQLSERADATANLAVLDRSELEVIFVEQIDSPREFQIRFRIGKPVAPHATGVGKILLAYLDAATARQVVRKHGMKRMTRRTITDWAELRRELDCVREEGYAVDREETVEGASCIAVPVRDHTGEVVAAVSVSMMTSRMRRLQRTKLIGLVKGFGVKISAALGCDDLKALSPLISRL